MAMMDQTIPHQLDYAPPPKRRLLTKRRVFWLTVGLLAALATYFAWSVYVPKIRDRLDAARQRTAVLQGCIAHTMLTTEPAFDEGTAKVPCRLTNVNPDLALCRQNRTDTPLRPGQLQRVASTTGMVFQLPFGGWGPISPSCWSVFLVRNLNVGLRQPANRQQSEGDVHNAPIHEWRVEMVNGDYRSAPQFGHALNSLLYLGSLTTPGGEQRLIHLSFDGPAFVWGGKSPFRIVSYPTHWSLRAYTPVESDSSAGLDYSDLRPFKIFPAQRDPKNPSHLTMVYQFGPDKGTIDVRLDNAGQLTLSRRP
ncbi:MAG: hypothetical protein ACHRHE_05970 [Tepidisphaerales bacterium]